MVGIDRIEDSDFDPLKLTKNIDNIGEREPDEKEINRGILKRIDHLIQPEFCCSLWEPGLRHFDSMICFCGIQSAGPKFNPKYQFKYCPWCGAKLPTEPENNT